MRLFVRVSTKLTGNNLAIAQIQNAHFLHPTTSKTILLVEDYEDCRELQACVIRRLGYVVIEVDNGARAIEEAVATQPDLILMDLGMPKMNGDDAIVQLKSLPSTKDIPVIICTAHIPGPRINRARDAGAIEILHKPFKFSKLENLLRKYVSSEQKSGTGKALDFSDALR